jgi:hypothetical protein
VSLAWDRYAAPVPTLSAVAAGDASLVDHDVRDPRDGWQQPSLLEPVAARDELVVPGRASPPEPSRLRAHKSECSYEPPPYSLTVCRFVDAHGLPYPPADHLADLQAALHGLAYACLIPSIAAVVHVDLRTTTRPLSPAPCFASPPTPPRGPPVSTTTPSILGPDGEPLGPAAGTQLEPFSRQITHREAIDLVKSGRAYTPEAVLEVQKAAGRVVPRDDDLIGHAYDVEKRGDDRRGARSQGVSFTSIWDRNRGKPKPTPITVETLRLMSNRAEWVRAIIKTRKNQIGKVPWAIVPKDEDDKSARAPRR